MSIFRYTASIDNTIVNAFQPNLTTRGTGANCGQADIVEVYSIYGHAPMATSSQASGSQELSRILMQFPISQISADRTSNKIPASGSVSFYLKLHNAETSKTVPRDFALEVFGVSQEWEEGLGLDLENYKDLTKGNIGSNWIKATKTTNWTSSAGAVGGSYLTGTNDPKFKQAFSTGLEDLEVDISPLSIGSPAPDQTMVLESCCLLHMRPIIPRPMTQMSLPFTHPVLSTILVELLLLITLKDFLEELLSSSSRDLVLKQDGIAPREMIGEISTIVAP